MDDAGGQREVPVVEAPKRSAAAHGALAALLAHLALVDAAVEIAWGGSALRWWTTPALLGAGALNLWLFRPGASLLRRAGPAAAAAAPVAALLALLVLAAWLPGEGGIRLFGHAASLALCLVSAAAVTAGVCAVIRVRLLPPAALVSLAACGAYAVAAFLVAAYGGVSYREALRGSSLWIRLPFFLQGAFLGVFAVLPVSIACDAVAAFRRVGSPWRLQRVVALPSTSRS